MRQKSQKIFLDVCGTQMTNKFFKEASEPNSLNFKYLNLVPSSFCKLVKSNSSDISLPNSL